MKLQRISLSYKGFFGKIQIHREAEGYQSNNNWSFLHWDPRIPDNGIPLTLESREGVIIEQPLNDLFHNWLLVIFF